MNRNYIMGKAKFLSTPDYAEYIKMNSAIEACEKADLMPPNQGIAYLKAFTSISAPIPGAKPMISKDLAKVPVEANFIVGKLPKFAIYFDKDIDSCIKYKYPKGFISGEVDLRLGNGIERFDVVGKSTYLISSSALFSWDPDVFGYIFLCQSQTSDRELLIYQKEPLEELWYVFSDNKYDKNFQNSYYRINCLKSIEKDINMKNSWKIPVLLKSLFARFIKANKMHHLKCTTYAEVELGEENC